jgi:hypothetical protein
MKKPITVLILTILAALAGIWGIVDVLRYLGLVPWFTIAEVDFYGVNWLSAILAGVVALIWFWTARGLWNLDQQSWLFVVVIAIVYLIFDLVAILGKVPFQELLPSIILSGLALIIALLPGTQKAYGRG